MTGMHGLATMTSFISSTLGNPFLTRVRSGGGGGWLPEHSSQKNSKASERGGLAGPSRVREKPHLSRGSAERPRATKASRTEEGPERAEAMA